MRRALHWLAEASLALPHLLGWALLTLAVAQLVPPRVVWPASGGLLLLTCGGWGIIWDVARAGLYALSQEPDTNAKPATKPATKPDIPRARRRSA